MQCDSKEQHLKEISLSFHQLNNIGKKLEKIRLFIGLSQDEIAFRMGISKFEISKIEKCEDLQTSMLKQYLGALDLDFEFCVNLKHIDFANLNLDKLCKSKKKNSLLTRDIVLSVHPKYSAKILLGEKTVELRRRFPVNTPKGTKVYVYSTSPECALIGIVEIKSVMKHSIEDIWHYYSEAACIEKKEFKEYFNGLANGCVLEVQNARFLRQPLELAELRKKYHFTPPQSFIYAQPSLSRALKNDYAKLSY